MWTYCSEILTSKGKLKYGKKLQKINDLIDSDVIILIHLSKKTVKRVYFKIVAVYSYFIQSN